MLFRSHVWNEVLLSVSDLKVELLTSISPYANAVVEKQAAVNAVTAAMAVTLPVNFFIV